MDIDKVINQTIDKTIVKLKLAGLMKDNRQTAFQKTEEILKNYNELKKSYSEDGTARKFIDIVDKALVQLQDDYYYNIIQMMYFDKCTREEIADYYDTTVTTISRNKRRLVNKLKVLIFADDVIYELFL